MTANAADIADQQDERLFIQANKSRPHCAEGRHFGAIMRFPPDGTRFGGRWAPHLAPWRRWRDRCWCSSSEKNAPGTGKSRLARQLGLALGNAQVSESDRVRKTLFADPTVYGR